MSAFHTTAQDIQNQESRFGSKNEDVSAMKVRNYAQGQPMMLPGPDILIPLSVHSQ